MNYKNIFWVGLRALVVLILIGVFLGIPESLVYQIQYPVVRAVAMAIMLVVGILALGWALLKFRKFIFGGR